MVVQGTSLFYREHCSKCTSTTNARWIFIYCCLNNRFPRQTQQHRIMLSTTTEVLCMRLSVSLPGMTPACSTSPLEQGGAERASPHGSGGKEKEWGCHESLELSCRTHQPAAATKGKSRLSANSICCLWTWKRRWWTGGCRKERGAYMFSDAFLRDLNIPFSKPKKAVLLMKFNALTRSIFRR